jgi:hypothetical protein
MRVTLALPIHLAAWMAAPLALPGVAAAQTGGGYDLTWNTLDCGGGVSSAGPYELYGAIGQPGAGGLQAGGSYALAGGFLPGSAAPCYANCDGSTTAPLLNVADFSCFLQKFAAVDAYANCDGSTAQPVLNVADFSCFLQRFAAGCP